MIFALHDAHLNDESGGSLFMTVRILVRRPFFPSHTRLLSVLTRASTSGMLAFMDMALSSFSSWLFSRRYLFLKDGNNLNNKQNLQHIVRSKGTQWVTYSWWSLKLWSSLRNWILKDISCTMKMLISVNCCVKGSLMAQSHVYKNTVGLKIHTGLQSQFSFWPCTTWFEAVYFLQISLSNRLLSPGMRRNSASILCTCAATKYKAAETEHYSFNLEEEGDE